MDESDREDIRQKYEKERAKWQAHLENSDAISRLVRILQVIVPLAAAKQLGKLEVYLQDAKRALAEARSIDRNVEYWEEVVAWYKHKIEDFTPDTEG